MAAPGGSFDHTGLPPQRRPRRRDLNWEDHKATLKSLYLEKDKKLDDIMEIMQEQQDFVATYTNRSLLPSHSLTVAE